MSEAGGDKATTAPAEAEASILFVCTLNAVRSPIAATIARSALGSDVRIDSVGVYEGYADPFAAAVMAEAGYDLSSHEPKQFDDVKQDDFSVVVALTEEALRAVEERYKGRQVSVEYWPIPNPSDVHGGREQIMDSYRTAREELRRRIHERFRKAPPASK
ncbi:MAG: low molecular weight phosphatase family protein [Pseudomonadota bacterium]